MPETLSIKERVAAMDETDLLIRRQELQTLGRDTTQRPNGLLEDELEEICTIYARLRTKKAPLPKTSKAAVNRRAKQVDIFSLMK